MAKLNPLNQKVEMDALTEMEMLQVYGGTADLTEVLDSGCDAKCGANMVPQCACQNNVAQCGCSTGSGSGTQTPPPANPNCK